MNIPGFWMICINNLITFHDRLLIALPFYSLGLRTIKAAINLAEDFHKPTLYFLFHTLDVWVKVCQAEFLTFQQQAGRLSLCVARLVAAFLFNRAHVCQWQGAAQPIIVCLRQSDSWVVLMLCDRTGGEWEKQTQKLRREFILFKLHLCKSVSRSKRWRWVYCSLRETCQQHCYCSYPMNQRTWLQVLCQWASEKSEQGLELLPPPGLLLFNWPCALMFLLKGPNKIGKFPHGVNKLTQCLEKQKRMASTGLQPKLIPPFFGFT